MECNGGDVWGEVELETVMRSRYSGVWRERKLYSEDVCGMENCSVGYDSVLRCSVWEYRDGYRDQIFLISACIQNH